MPAVSTLSHWVDWATCMNGITKISKIGGLAFLCACLAASWKALISRNKLSRSKHAAKKLFLEIENSLFFVCNGLVSFFDLLLIGVFVLIESRKHSMEPVSSVLPKNQNSTICTNLLLIWPHSKIHKIMNGFKKKLAFIKPRMRSSAFRLSLAFCLTSSSLSDMSVCLRPRSGKSIRRKNSPWPHGP